MLVFMTFLLMNGRRNCAKATTCGCGTSLNDVSKFPCKKCNQKRLCSSCYMKNGCCLNCDRDQIHLLVDDNDDDEDADDDEWLQFDNSGCEESHVIMDSVVTASVPISEQGLKRGYSSMLNNDDTPSFDDVSDISYESSSSQILMSREPLFQVYIPSCSPYSP